MLVIGLEVLEMRFPDTIERVVGVYSRPAERLSAVGARYILGAAETRQGEAVAGAGHDRYRHQTLQQGLRQGRRRNRGL